MPFTLHVPQDRETPATEVLRERFVYRYAYARSDDTKRAAQPGQDYLVVREEGVRLAFALCDGVSQSFFGDLAARLLGDALVDWLWEQPPQVEATQVQLGLAAQLGALVTPASEQVESMALPQSLPPVVRDVLEQKRQLGSEANFVAGLVDTNARRLLLAWLGDLRLRLWDTDDERTVELGATFLTSERWSSRRGVIGEIHVDVRAIGDLKRIASYSDGLAALDRHPALTMDNVALDDEIARASASLTSDDISLIEVALTIP